MCQTVGASFAYLLLCATLFIVTDSKKDKHVVKGHEDIDDPNFDPYTSMDPKLREPSPCEGEYSFAYKIFRSALKATHASRNQHFILTS